LAVYEVWGDLLFEAYEPASQHTHTIYAPLTLMVSALSDEPDTLKLYLLAGGFRRLPPPAHTSHVPCFHIHLAV
jgi:hypothetical protein